jgi:hypothetical protein
MLEMKSDLEHRRSTNEWATVSASPLKYGTSVYACWAMQLIWQFNEIWPTGGWAAVEYGTVNYTAGQVLGGRWKPLQHIIAQQLYLGVFPKL